MTILHKITASILDEPIKDLGTLRQAMREHLPEEVTDDHMNEVFSAWGRSALEAMMEPTRGMLDASNREWDGRMDYRSSGAWQAMITQALKEGE